MKIPGASSPETGENQPMATEADLDNLIQHAGSNLETALNAWRENMGFEPREFDPNTIGITATRSELEQYPTLRRWDTGELQYMRPRINDTLPVGHPERIAQHASMLAIFTAANSSETQASGAHIRTINLTPSFAEEEVLDLTPEQKQAHGISSQVPLAEVQDISAFLDSTVTADRLVFPGARYDDEL